VNGKIRVRPISQNTDIDSTSEHDRSSSEQSTFVERSKTQVQEEVMEVA